MASSGALVPTEEGDSVNLIGYLDINAERDRARLVGVDILRGLVLILMVIDTTYTNFMSVKNSYRNEIWYYPAIWQGSFIEFITRQITHPAAPGFFLLMGIGMSLFYKSRRQMRWTKLKIFHYFIKRGLLLCALDVVWVNGFLATKQAISHNWDGYTFVFGCLWGLGCTMIFGSIIMFIQLIRSCGNRSCFLLCPRLHPGLEGRLGSIFVVLIIITTLLTTQYSIPQPITEDSYLNPMTGVFVVSSYYNFSSTFRLYIEYPPFSWLGVVLLGILLGQGLRKNRSTTVKTIGLLSIASLMGFISFRLMYFYEAWKFGNIRPLHPHSSSYYDFFALTKYPPSLTFLLWTVGLNLGFFWIISNVFEKHYKTWFLLPFTVFGSTSLFFYLTHLWVSGLLSLPFYPQGISSVGWVYLESIVILYVLFPSCFIFRNFKRLKDKDSLWRLV